MQQFSGQERSKYCEECRENYGCTYPLCPIKLIMDGKGGNYA